MTHPTPKELIAQVSKGLRHSGDCDWNTPECSCKIYLSDNALNQLSALFDATEVSAQEVAENIGIFSAEKLATRIRERPWEDYALDIEDVALPIIQSALITAAGKMEDV